MIRTSRGVQVTATLSTLLFYSTVAQGQAPSISSFSPSHGSVGTTITISGNNRIAVPKEPLP